MFSRGRAVSTAFGAAGSFRICHLRGGRLHCPIHLVGRQGVRLGHRRVRHRKQRAAVETQLVLDFIRLRHRSRIGEHRDGRVKRRHRDRHRGVSGGVSEGVVADAVELHVVIACARPVDVRRRLPVLYIEARRRADRRAAGAPRHRHPDPVAAIRDLGKLGERPQTGRGRTHFG